MISPHIGLTSQRQDKGSRTRSRVEEEIFGCVSLNEGQNRLTNTAMNHLHHPVIDCSCNLLYMFGRERSLHCSLLSSHHSPLCVPGTPKTRRQQKISPSDVFGFYFRRLIIKLCFYFVYQRDILLFIQMSGPRQMVSRMMYFYTIPRVLICLNNKKKAFKRRLSKPVCCTVKAN